MTSSSDTFPFGIADVVELLGLTVRRRLPSSLYLNCPFCGDLRGRLNVNTDKNVWRCNRCGAAGGMLALYARYNCTGNADAYREICEALGRYTPRPRVNDCIGVKPEQNARAAPQEIHQTYSLLLSMLPLTPTHKAHLLSPRRGLTEEQIARFGFKSPPPAFLFPKQMHAVPALTGILCSLVPTHVCSAHRSRVQRARLSAILRTENVWAAARRASCSRLSVWMV